MWTTVYLKNRICTLRRKTPHRIFSKLSAGALNFSKPSMSVTFISIFWLCDLHDVLSKFTYTICWLEWNISLEFGIWETVLISTLGIVVRVESHDLLNSGLQNCISGGIDRKCDMITPLPLSKNKRKLITLTRLPRHYCNSFSYEWLENLKMYYNYISLKSGLTIDFLLLLLYENKLKTDLMKRSKCCVLIRGARWRECWEINRWKTLSDPLHLVFHPTAHR